MYNWNVNYKVFVEEKRMVEKIRIVKHLHKKHPQGYFKPKGKYCKRSIHKLARRMKDLDTNRKGIYNRIGVYWEWD